MGRAIFPLVDFTILLFTVSLILHIIQLRKQLLYFDILLLRVYQLTFQSFVFQLHGVGGGCLFHASALGRFCHFLEPLSKLALLFQLSLYLPRVVSMLSDLSLQLLRTKITSFLFFFEASDLHLRRLVILLCAQQPLLGTLQAPALIRHVGLGQEQLFLQNGMLVNEPLGLDTLLFQLELQVLDLCIQNSIALHERRTLAEFLIHLVLQTGDLHVELNVFSLCFPDLVFQFHFSGIFRLVWLLGNILALRLSVVELLSQLFEHVPLVQYGLSIERLFLFRRWRSGNFSERRLRGRLRVQPGHQLTAKLIKGSAPVHTVALPQSGHLILQLGHLLPGHVELGLHRDHLLLLLRKLRGQILGVLELLPDRLLLHLRCL
mmetsp:Transcript_49414/g.131147  ORF Transcript_49414/g.131147 Transcript_49414/m.131147 type:complete len:376 (-) Transcript_49414:3382-4509(-)